MDKHDRKEELKSPILGIDREYYNTLDLESFSQMLKDPSYCYKFYWLEAIVNLISRGVESTTFDEIINEMICSAWYSVREFHIHLSGLRSNGDVDDGLERAILKLSELSELPANASRDEILNEIKKHDRELYSAKEQLTHMVPYRALAGFFVNAGKKNEIEWEAQRRLIAYVEAFNRDVELLPYTFGSSSKLAREVRFSHAWARMIQDNTATILGWIQFEKISWLQRNNPEVPGLVFKLAPMNEKLRKLNNVRKLWKGILEIHDVRDVFTGESIKNGAYDIDHFIPWSFVMNDELWNLMPMDSSLNSSKSNRLPQWDPFFEGFSNNQYVLYELIQEYPAIHRLYEKCWKDNLHSIWAGSELYHPGNTKETFQTILEKNMRPVYDSARRQGYEVWRVTF